MRGAGVGPVRLARPVSAGAAEIAEVGSEPLLRRGAFLATRRASGSPEVAARGPVFQRPCSSHGGYVELVSSREHVTGVSALSPCQSRLISPREDLAASRAPKGVRHSAAIARAVYRTCRIEDLQLYHLTGLQRA